MAFQRIGHGGASALAPANTLDSFEAGLAAGVDVLEFDVRGWRGRLVLAHTALDAPRSRLTLREALRHLAGPRFAAIELNLDVKHVGCEAALLEELARTGLTHRAVVSSQVAAVLDCVRERDPAVRRAISVGGRIARASRRWGDWKAGVLRGMGDGRWDMVMAQHRLTSPQLCAQVAERGGRLCAWTVNDKVLMDRLRAVGVDGIVSADPRLFTGAAARQLSHAV